MATWAVCTASAVSTDADGGTVDWANGTPAGTDSIAEQSEATGLAAGTTTNCGTITLAATEQSYWRNYTGTPKLGTDAYGDWSVPADATVTDFEAIIKCARTAGDSVITVDDARFNNAGTRGAGDLSDGEIIFTAGTTNGTRGQNKCPRFRGLSGTSPTRAAMLAGTCGISFKALATGGVNGTVGVDCVQLKFGVTFANATATIRSNASEVCPAPFPYFAHACASEILDYSPVDLTYEWEWTAYPVGWDPGTITNPLSGRPGQHAYLDLKQGRGFNHSRLLDVAGDYTVRLRIRYQGTVIDDVTENITVAANNRTHAYVDASATGANDGTSLANAWTSLDDGIDWLDAGDDRHLHVEEGTYTLASTGNSVTTQNQSVCECAAGVKIRATTDSGAAMVSLVDCFQFVWIGGKFETANGTEANWGLTTDAQCQSVYFQKVQPGDTGHRLVSLFEMGSAAAGTRRQTTFDRCCDDATHVGTLRYGGFITQSSDVSIIGGRWTTAATTSTEALWRMGGGMDVQTETCRVCFEGVDFDGATFGQGIRIGYSWVYLSNCKGELYVNANYGFCETKTGDTTTNCGAMYVAIENCELLGKNTVLIGGSSGGGRTDCRVRASVLVGEEGSERTCGHARAIFDQCTIWKADDYTAGSSNGLTFRQFSSSGPFSQGSEENTIVGCLAATVNPTSDDRTLVFNDGQSTGDPFTKIDNNVTCQVSHANGERNNFEIEDVATNNAGLNALAIADGNIRHRSAVQAQFPASQGYARKKEDAVSTTVATGTSTTVFTLTAGSANDHAYVGWTFTVGGTARVCSVYVGSTRTVTLATALGGTPSGGTAVTAVPDVSGMAIAEVVDTMANTDLRGCTIRRTNATQMVGASQDIPSDADAETLTLTPIDGGFTASLSGGNGEDIIVWYVPSGGDLDSPYERDYQIIANGGSLTGLSNGTTYDAKAAFITDEGGEGEWSPVASKAAGEARSVQGFGFATRFLLGI